MHSSSLTQSQSLPNSPPRDGKNRGSVLGPALSQAASSDAGSSREMDKQQARLVLLRDAVKLAMTELNQRLDRLEKNIQGLAAPDPKMAKKVRDLVRFLRRLVETDENERMERLVHNAHTAGMSAQTTPADRLAFFQHLMSMAVIESRCKLGSIAKRVSTTASLTVCMADAQAIRSIKKYLDGEGTLEIDLTKHKPIAPSSSSSSSSSSGPSSSSSSSSSSSHPSSSSSSSSTSSTTSSNHPTTIPASTSITKRLQTTAQEDKFTQLVKLTGVTADEVIEKLELLLHRAIDFRGDKAGSDKSQKQSDQYVRRILDIQHILESDDDDGFDTKLDHAREDGEARRADPMGLVQNMITVIEDTYLSVQNIHHAQDQNKEIFVKAVRFAKKLREIKKYLLRVGKNLPQSEEGWGARSEGGAVSLSKLQELLKKEEDEETGRSFEKEEDVQEDISGLNTRRHLLTLAIRNFDRKINILIKSRKLKEEAREEDEDEVFQFFDQSTSEDNPLGARKAAYEQFVSLLRRRPRVLAGVVRYLSFAEMDPLVQTITFSLFSDLFLAREEYLILLLIDEIMSVEFEGCKDIEFYLRANSFITKLLAGYTKRQSGRMHLVQALKDSVVAVVSDHDLDLEMDTAKLAQKAQKTKTSDGSLPVTMPVKPVGPSSPSPSGDTPDPEGGKDDEDPEGKKGDTDVKFSTLNLAGELPEVRKMFQDHKLKLMYYCKLFLDSITATLNTMPFGIRWIAKQLVNHAREKFPEVTPGQIDILVGGFIFLRYLVPGIVTPEAHGLVTHVGTGARRNLVLIAKVLQNLANGCLFSKKEPFMLSMNSFISDHMAAIHEYFIMLCNVGDAGTYYKNSSLKRVAPQQIERTVTVSPNELYTIHRYILKHQSDILKTPNDPMLPLLATLGAAPEAVPRRQNKFVLLNVYSLQTDDSDQAAEEKGKVSDKDMEQMRDELRRVILLAPQVPGDDRTTLPDLLRLVLSSVDSPDAQLLGIDLFEKLDRLPPKMKEGGYKDLLAELEKDYQQRQLLREAILTERIEQLESLEYQKKEVARLLEEKKIYAEYLQNVQVDAFLKKIRNRPMIGPFNFTFRELEKKGIIQGTVIPDHPMRQGGDFKMSCTTPGAVNITAKYKKYSKFWEVQLSELMDDLVLHDTVVYDDITFDIRKLISFVNRNVIG
eukprot:TRINITY_DN413_c1_g1_i6.p1 TRINITY_DN413_c1_g1~~TRINITY_DN413_c1_g1_i6.p1  ORF type:complete len:1287 (-),score=491.71 TRINITY_DN413_c1_g1_i6:955-4473(-)